MALRTSLSRTSVPSSSIALDRAAIASAAVSLPARRSARIFASRRLSSAAAASVRHTSTSRIRGAEGHPRASSQEHMTTLLPGETKGLPPQQAPLMTFEPRLNPSRTKRVYARAASASAAVYARGRCSFSPLELAEGAFNDLAADALSRRRELLGRADPTTEQPSDRAAAQAEFGDAGSCVVSRDGRPCCTSLGREVVSFPAAALLALKTDAAVGVVGGGMGDASAPPWLVGVVRKQELGRNATFSFGRDLARPVAIRGELSVQCSISTL
jgi:hypothetical protein